MERKINTGRKLIFAATLVAMLMAMWTEVVAPKYFQELQPDPQSILIGLFGLGVSSIYLYGLFLCSRAVGVPLTVSYFLRLSFGFPNWILYIIGVASPLIFG